LRKVLKFDNQKTFSKTIFVFILMVMKKGFTLIEVLIAVALFGIAGTIAANIVVDSVKLEKKSEIHNTIYRDASILMQQIVNEIRGGTIDYEEYFSIHVVQDTELKYHGIYYGVYASRFYDPGLSLWGDGETSNPNHLGVECSFPEEETNISECDIVYTLSYDTNTGKNPYDDDDVNNANAFCKVNCTGNDFGTVNELYLIDSTGTRKTIIAAKGEEDAKRVGIVRMTGIDFDQNGIVDIFSCDEGFDCETVGNNGKVGGGGDQPGTRVIYYPGFIDASISDNVSIPNNNPEDNNAFVPISPARAHVENLTFIIRPVEDPYRAYAEPEMQQHPSVTIILTLGLSPEGERNYPGDFKPITIQTTVAVGAKDRIESYPPVTELRGENDDSWIKDVLN
jgi:prepilin-type N-terminal cleavage/methylation domain-containing protein